MLLQEEKGISRIICHSIYSYAEDPYKILIIGSGKTNSLFNVISQQPDIDKIHMLKVHTKQNIDS